MTYRANLKFASLRDICVYRDYRLEEGSHTLKSCDSRFYKLRGASSTQLGSVALTDRQDLIEITNRIM